MPTASTLPLLLLIALLWKLTRGNVLAIVLFTCVFDAASALNFGGIGLAPWIATLVLGIAVKLIFGHRPFVFAKQINLPAFGFLLAFILYAIVSSVAGPNLFSGIPVQKLESIQPLSWSTTNLSQLCYLLAVAVVFMLAASRQLPEMEEAIQWYVRGCVVSCFFAIYQLANAIFHVPYPDAVLYSNPSHMIYPAYQMSGFWRLNSTFPEASEMAGFFALAVGMLGWEMVTKRATLWSCFKLALMLCCLIWTFSTTGYLTVAFIIVTSAALYMRHIWARGTIAPGTLIAGIVLGSCLVGSFGLSSVRAGVTQALSSTIVDKADSDSYRARTETHAAAWETAQSTYLLGAGWGSVRPSGLFFVLLANVGVIGIATFAGMVLSLGWPLVHANRNRTRHYLYEKSLFGTAIMLVAMLIAGAEPVTPILWALFGIAAASGWRVGTKANQRLESKDLTTAQYSAATFGYLN
jgi:O-Antigen ligase